MPKKPLADRIIERAAAQVGIKEDTGKNDGEPSRRYMGGRKEPWCAHFVAWLFRMEHRPIPGDSVPSEKVANALASVAYMQSVFEDFGWMVMEPKPGDVIFFSNRLMSDRGPGRHCGIVESVNDAKVFTIEGNMSNAVGRCVYRRTDPKITGYGRVPELESDG